MESNDCQGEKVVSNLTEEQAHEFARELDLLLKKYKLTFCSTQMMFPMTPGWPDLKAETDLLRHKPQDGIFIVYYDWPGGKPTIRTSMEST